MRRGTAFTVLTFVTSCSLTYLRLPEPPPDAAVDGAAPGDAMLDAMADAGPVPTGLVVEAAVPWRTGDFPVALGGATGRFCFLQSVAGMLRATSHEVVVAAVGANWLLSGTAPDANVIARCLTFEPASGITLTPPVDWTQGQPFVDLGPFGDRICALTRIAGVFNGGGELVHAEATDNRWRLRGTSLASGVSASARCLVFPPATEVAIGGEVNWAQGDATASLAPRDRHACVITLIAGSFLGGGERVTIEASGTGWVLTGSSAQAGVAARARCVGWP